jgi:5-formyltetrahydrofolate cyclo-ligase
MTQPTNKEALRKTFLEKRKALSPGEIAQRNQLLYHSFFHHFDFSFVKVIHTYLPLEKNNEPDTWQILDKIKRDFPHVRISVPKVNRSTNELENIFFEGLHQIEPNAWGIPEPKQGVPTPSDKIDFVIVPLLAFDKTGNRVGYGRGYYDRFLKDCRGDFKKTGLSFFDPVDEITDTNNYDIKLNGCVTPSKVIFFDNPKRQEQH